MRKHLFKSIVTALLVSSAAFDALGEGFGPGALDEDSSEVERYSLQHSGAVDPMGATFVFDFAQNPNPYNGGTTVPSTDGSYTMTIAGTPDAVRDGTYPYGITGVGQYAGAWGQQQYAWNLDGSTEYLSLPDASGGDDFDPAGDFTVACHVLPTAIDASDAIITKWNGVGDQRSWAIYFGATTSVTAFISKDGTTAGGSSTSMSVASAAANGKPVLAAMTYDYIADGSSVMKLYAGDKDPSTSSVAVGPIYDSTADVRIGDGNGWPTKLSGRFSWCAAWNEALTGDQIDQIRSGKVNPADVGTPFWLWNASGTVAGTYVQNMSQGEIGAYTWTVGGTPDRVAEPSWHRGYGWTFDGSTDYLEEGSTLGEFSGSFSACLAITVNSTAAGTRVLAGRYTGGSNNKSWMIYQSGTSLSLAVSDDGTSGAGHQSTTGRSGLRVGAMSDACIVYEYVADGSSVGTIYLEDLTPTPNSSMDGPPATVATTKFRIGSTADNFYWALGSVHVLHMWDRALTAAEVKHWQRQWRGAVSSSGNEIDNYTTVIYMPDVLMAESNSGVEPYLINAPTGGAVYRSSIVGARGLVAVEYQNNLVNRGVLETWAAGSPTGWTETIAGGTSDATQYTTRKAQGLSSALLTCDGINAVDIASGCKTATAATDYYLQAEALTVSGAPTLSLIVEEHLSANCTDGVPTQTTIYTGNPGSNWTRKQGKRTTGVGINSIRVVVMANTTAGAVAVDAVQLRQSSYPVDHFCGTDADSTAQCGQLLPLIRPIPMSLAGVSQWEIEAYFETPYAVGDISGTGWYMWYSRSNSGTDNLPNIQLDTSLGHSRFTVHSGGGKGATDSCWVYGGGWTANTAHHLKATYYLQGADGDLRYSVDNTPAAAGSGCAGTSPRAYMDGWGIELALGGTYSAAKGSTWIKDLIVKRGTTQ